MFSLRLLTTGVVGLTLYGCTSIDCPLDNQVLMTLNFYDVATQKSATIAQKLSVYGLKNGNEELLFNQGENLKSISIPLNAASDCDTLLFKFAEGDAVMTERLIIEHTRQQHFESLDCPSVTFHQLKAIEHTTHDLSILALAIDHISIANPNVQYEDTEHIKVYLRTSAQ